MTVASAKCIAPLMRCWIFTIVFHQFIQQSYAAPNPPRGIVPLTDWAQYNHREPEGRGTYAFGYDVEDPETNNIQYRSEQRHANGTVTGSYGYLEPNGNIHMVHYIADQLGYRATVEDSSRGGMLKPIPVLQDVNYIAYGYSPQMLAAMKSQQIYSKQKVHDQRERPIDQQSEERKLLFRQNTNENQKLNEKSANGHNKLQQTPFTSSLPTVYPYFNSVEFPGSDDKSEDALDFLPFA